MRGRGTLTRQLRLAMGALRRVLSVQPAEVARVALKSSAAEASATGKQNSKTLSNLIANRARVNVAASAIARICHIPRPFRGVWLPSLLI